MKVALAALFYFAAVFGAGFLLGPIRVLLLEPRLGSLVALLCEAPLLLVVMMFAARRIPAAVRLKPDTGALATVGVAALMLQQVADLTVGVTLRGIGIVAQLARFLTVEGLLYAGLLVLFAAMPLLANRVKRADAHSSGSVVNRSG
ncbi:MAG: hypothetical protein AB7I42_05495 [Bradyrhizobium sp.]|uniref:hypothetical protein n=1 Tax=Bradyrhizobium sp. TaxID=376 RepID=UPI003D0C518B